MKKILVLNGSGRSKLYDYLGFQNLDIISAKGFENPNDIENSQILIDAFELGKSIV